MPSPSDLKLTLPNAQGEAVLRLQKALGAQGYTIEADATYGIGTEKVVKRFQEDVGLPITGIADLETLKALGL